MGKTLDALSAKLRKLGLGPEPAFVNTGAPGSMDYMQQQLPDIRKRQARAARLRGSQERWDEAAKKRANAIETPTMRGGLYETVGQTRANNWAPMLESLVGAIGGSANKNMADTAENEVNKTRESEVRRTAEQIGVIRARPAGTKRPEGEPTEAALRAYLGQLTGDKDASITDLGLNIKPKHFSGYSIDETPGKSKGERINWFSDGTSERTGTFPQGKATTVSVKGQPISMAYTSGQYAGTGAPVLFSEDGNPLPQDQYPEGMAPQQAGSTPTQTAEVDGTKAAMTFPELSVEANQRMATKIALLESLKMPEQQKLAYVEQMVAEEMAKGGPNDPTAAGAAPPVGAPAPQPGAAGVAPPVAPGIAPAPIAQAPRGKPMIVPSDYTEQTQKNDANFDQRDKLAQVETEKAMAGEWGKRRAEYQISLPEARVSLNHMGTTLEKLIAHPGFSKIAGGSFLGMVGEDGKIAELSEAAASQMSPEAADAWGLFKQVVGENYAAAFRTLKGSGPVTEKETERVANAAAALRKSSSPAALAANMREMKESLEALYGARERVAKGEWQTIWGPEGPPKGYTIPGATPAAAPAAAPRMSAERAAELQRKYGGKK